MSFFMYSRAVILVTIIVSTGPVARDIAFAGDLVARVRPNPPGNNQWFGLVVPMAGFALVSLVGRGRSHPAPALFAEGIIASVLFLTPPFQWVKWFGLNNDFVDASGGTLGAFGLMQPLSAMWLGVVIATALSGNKRARSLGRKP